MLKEESLAKILFRTAAFLLIAYIFMVSIRVTVAPMHWTGVFYIVATCSMLIITMLLSWRCRCVRGTAYFLLFSLMILIYSRAFLAGGSESPIMMIAILLPMAAMFLLGKQASLLMMFLCLFITGSYVLMSMFGYQFAPLGLEGRTHSIVNGVVAMFVIAVGSWVALLYAEQNESLQEKLRLQTHKDHLTGIANRRAFDETIEREVGRSRRQGTTLSVFMLDIDNFKKYNDRYGHHKGDECLISVANILQSCLRRPGDMVARYGGEELVAILPETEMPNAQALAETMRHAVKGLKIPHEDSDEGVVTITAGVSAFPVGEQDDLAHLLERADKALYQGKKNGKDQVVVIS